MSCAAHWALNGLKPDRAMTPEQGGTIFERKHLVCEPTSKQEDDTRKMMMATAGLVLLVAPALGQNPPAQNGPGNNAVNSPNTNNANAPVAGANSFTEGQAKSRIESSGFSNVSALRKDDQGVWRGKAQKDGKSVDVSLEFQGNVIGP